MVNNSQVVNHASWCLHNTVFFKCLQLQLTSRLDEDAGIDAWAKCNRVSVLLAHAHHAAYIYYKNLGNRKHHP